MNSDIVLASGALVVLFVFVAAVIMMLYVHRFAERITTKNAEIEEYRLRIAACIDALRDCQLANMTLGAAVSEREESIGVLLQRVNEANARAAAYQQLLKAEYVYVLADTRVLGPFSVS